MQLYATTFDVLLGLAFVLATVIALVQSKSRQAKILIARVVILVIVVQVLLFVQPYLSAIVEPRTADRTLGMLSFYFYKSLP